MSDSPNWLQLEEAIAQLHADQATHDRCALLASLRTYTTAVPGPKLAAQAMWFRTQQIACGFGTGSIGRCSYAGITVPARP
jgi:hypothetical protein